MENIETMWVNLYSGAVPEYLYISGHCFGGGQTAPDQYRQQWRESLTNFVGMAAVAIREVECQCGRKARWLHIEGLIPGVTGAVPDIYLHSGSRGSLTEQDRDGAVTLRSWTGRGTGLLTGDYVEIRHAPDPPPEAGYVVPFYYGQTIRKFARPLCFALPVSREEHPCPQCRGKVFELAHPAWMDEEEGGESDESRE